jgi:hypothetical protein
VAGHIGFAVVDTAELVGPKYVACGMLDVYLTARILPKCNILVQNEQLLHQTCQVSEGYRSVCHHGNPICSMHEDFDGGAVDF